MREASGQTSRSFSLLRECLTDILTNPRDTLGSWEWIRWTLPLVIILPAGFLLDLVTIRVWRKIVLIVITGIFTWFAIMVSLYGSIDAPGRENPFVVATLYWWLWIPTVVAWMLLFFEVRTARDPGDTGGKSGPWGTAEQALSGILKKHLGAKPPHRHAASLRLILVK